jgi:hypothetical protein
LDLVGLLGIKELLAMTSSRFVFKSATQTGVVALASFVAAAAWRSFISSQTPSYDERVTPAAWRVGR